MYCKKCGGKIESYASHCPFCGEPLANNDVQATYTTSNQVQGTSQKSIGSWILTYIICAIPFVNIIMLCIWAFGSDTKSNPTFRNWARAQFIILVIGIVLVVLFCILVASVASVYLDEYKDLIANSGAYASLF
jgi:prepilin signal peptidase PulO-like enzyme (type II secretory pathway)